MAKRKNAAPQGYQARKVGTRERRQTFLIVCEGTKTEPNYFRGFRAPTVSIKIFGRAVSPSKIVEFAEEKRQDDDYDQVWCVFDRDEWSQSDFSQAIQKAYRLGLQVAYSNEAFELWYLLHFMEIRSAVSRHHYGSRLAQCLGSPYEKSCDTMYERLLPHQPIALERATKLLAGYEPANPEQDNPSTTVHLLVEQLNRFACR